MNKVYGLLTEFAPLRNERSRLVACYGKEPVGDGVHATWYEVYFYKKPHPVVTLEDIKSAVIADINAQTDEKILKGFMWEGKKVWLSTENQFNFKAAYDLAVQTQGASLPIKFKLGETEDGEPLYHTFNTLDSISDFYTKAIAYINQCLNEGWKRKDGIDFSVYELSNVID